MLNYKLIGRNDITDPQTCVFENRGIKDIAYYKNLDENCLVPYSALDNINKAVKLFLEFMNDHSIVVILVDCDADGYTSAAMMYNYIKKISPKTDVRYLIHSGKQHGLSDEIMEQFTSYSILTEEETKRKDTLLIIPDAGTNDAEQCAQLCEYMGIIVLDHHDEEMKNPYAIVVNNQTSENYSNKEFCGAGVVYKFLQAVDEELWNDYADDYLDLVALGNISDLMDVKSFETKYLIEKGLKSVKNKCFRAFIKGQEDRIEGKLNIHSVAFYISPLINAMCRVGDMEEKELLFKAFIEQDETFKYKKRGETEEIDESIYDRVVRLCKNAKSRQDNAVKKLIPKIKDIIEAKKSDKNKIMFVRCPDNTSGAFTGLVAMKLTDFYRKPCLLLRKQEDGTYRGSARNFDNSPVTDLKSEMSSIGSFEFCQGHAGAFGFQIQAASVSDTIKKCNEMFKDVDFSTVLVDFEIDFSDFDIMFIRDIDEMNDYFGTGLKEPIVVIKNIVLCRNQGSIMGKTENTWKFITDDNIAFVKFNIDDSDPVMDWLKNKKSNEIMINAICKIGFNNYNGVITPQAIINQYEVI